MQTKKLIISADDAGVSEDNNNAILSGIKSGLISSTGVTSNMPGFEHFVNNCLSVTDVDLGVHFNIFEGKSLTRADLLCDSEGYFNASFSKILFSQNNKKLLLQTENELRAQIEKVLAVHEVSHLDSHCHYHSIPAVFDIFLKVASEYGIKYIRTQKEPFYIVGNKIFNPKFPLNIVKHVLLNRLSKINAKKDVMTNDNFIGVLYTGYTDTDSILSGLKEIKTGLTEVIFHPYLPKKLATTTKIDNYKEFLITKNPGLKQKIENLGFEFTSFSKL